MFSFVEHQEKRKREAEVEAAELARKESVAAQEAKTKAVTEALESLSQDSNPVLNVDVSALKDAASVAKDAMAAQEAIPNPLTVIDTGASASSSGPEIQSSSSDSDKVSHIWSPPATKEWIRFLSSFM